MTDLSAASAVAARAEALFAMEGGLVIPTAYARSPWDHGYLHGGAVTGLVGWAIDTHRTGRAQFQVLTRMSVDILSMVPLAPLEVRFEWLKQGTRASTGDVTVLADGRRLVRATAQLVTCHDHRVESGAGSDLDSAVPTDPGGTVDFDYPRPGFNCDAVAIRSIVGNTEEPGPATVWIRPEVDVVAGHALTPLTRVAMLSDLGVAAGWEPSPTGVPFINPDVTLQLMRYPAADWVRFDSRISSDRSGVGFCESILADEFGEFGRVLQSLVEAPPHLSV